MVCETKRVFLLGYSQEGLYTDIRMLADSHSNIRLWVPFTIKLQRADSRTILQMFSNGQELANINPS